MHEPRRGAACKKVQLHDLGHLRQFFLQRRGKVFADEEDRLDVLLASDMDCLKQIPEIVQAAGIYEAVVEPEAHSYHVDSPAPVEPAAFWACDWRAIPWRLNHST